MLHRGRPGVSGLTAAGSSTLSGKPADGLRTAPITPRFANVNDRYLPVDWYGWAAGSDPEGSFAVLISPP